MAKIRESHFRRDMFGVVKVLLDGRTAPVYKSDGSLLRLFSMRDAESEARRLTTLAQFDHFARLAYRAEILANRPDVSRAPDLTHGTGF